MCILKDCHNKDKYGEYCTKHRRRYLLSCDQINALKFTNKESDYLKKDIITTIEAIHGANYLGVRNTKKKDAFLILQEVFSELKKYDEKDMDIIVKIQKKYKLRVENEINKLRGEGFVDKKKCNNDIDFFTYETRDEIKNKYYFSYKDENGFIWFFDIRSFNKLIEFKQPNPYTMSAIPRSIIKRSKLLTEKLKLGVSDEVIDHTQLQVSLEQMIKQKCIDLFCDIDNSGYYCQPSWFLNLNIPLLKKLYGNLEDLWNYRLQITSDVKTRISPPNGRVFTNRVSDVNRYSNIGEIRKLILNEVKKFQNAISPDDRKLGYMYFIIGLGTVSRECCETHPWIVHVWI